MKLERSNDNSTGTTTKAQRRQQANEGHATLSLDLIFHVRVNLVQRVGRHSSPAEVRRPMTTHSTLPTQGDILVLALTPAEIELAYDPAESVASTHAVQRYRERVEGVSRRLAARRLRSLLATAQWLSRPLPWTDVVLHPDVCLLLRGRVLVTVLSRRFLRRTVAGARAVAR